MNALVSPRKAAVPGWCSGRGWGWIWGEADETGALNAMTAESVAEALASVSLGRMFDLGVDVDERSFISTFHARTIVTTYCTAEGFKAAQGLDPKGVSFNTSLVAISDHAGTQIDALCHATFGKDDHFYNGFETRECRSDFGIVRASTSSMPPIVLTAVLIDVAARLGRDSLEPGFAIGPHELADALEGQGIDVAPGEAVFIRTGSLRHWGEAGHDHAALAGPDTAGITLAAARWLSEEKGAILVGSDTSTVEVLPPIDGGNASPVHKYLLVDQGVHMAELHYLEELSRERLYRFCYVALTPKVRGTTGAFAMRPLAVV